MRDTNRARRDPDGWKKRMLWITPKMQQQLPDEAVDAIGRYSGGVSTATISKTVQRVEARREADRAGKVRWLNVQQNSPIRAQRKPAVKSCRS